MKPVSFTRNRQQKPVLDKDALREAAHRSHEALEAGAASDADNPPVDSDRLTRMAVAREVRRIREGLGLSQPQFAATYRIGLARLRDWEQARSSPDLPLLALLRMIDQDPQKIALTVAEVETAFDAA